MSEEEQDDKKHDPSQKRLEDLQKKGNTPQSRELSGFMVGFFGIAAYAYMIYHGLINAHRLWEYSSDAHDLHAVCLALKEIMLQCLLIFFPVAFILWILPFLAKHFFGGLHIKEQWLSFDFSAFTPQKMRQNLFSAQNYFTVAISLLKLSIFVVVLVLFFYWKEPIFLQLLQAQGLGQWLLGLNLLLQMMFLLVGLSVCIVLVDIPFQQYTFLKKARMSDKELKDEYKESQGDPQLLSRRRKVQQELAKSRTVQAVAEATVLITNPTHYAVGLAYQRGVHAAPVVVTKGRGHIALAMREKAKTCNIPLIEAPPLARSLYQHTKVKQSIPKGLYVAVAHILRFLEKEEQHRQGTHDFENLPIPPDLQYKE